MRSLSGLRVLSLIVGMTALPAIPSFADDEVQLLPDGMLNQISKEMTEPGKFKKPPPWNIGMSFVGVGNTWIIQMIAETKYEVAHTPNIKSLDFTEADFKPAKQIADIEDLLARKVDALIVAPLAMPLVKPEVDKALAAGIPVINFGWSKGALPSTVEIMGAGGPFGEIGGKWLRDKLKGKGTIWVLRGVAGVQEETDRYEGLKKALEGSEIKIGAEVFGDWNYAKGKQLCENLVLSGQPVDGIWSSGAEMTRACIDVFKAAGKKLVPMTGEGNNGYFRAWKESGLESVSPVFTPQLGPANIRAAVALLEGKSLHKTYFSAPPPITNANLDKYYRPDLNDAYWVPSGLPEDELKKMFGAK